MTEPRYLPIPFLPAYGVDRDGVVCRLDPYRKVRPIPFHDALREASRHAGFQTVQQHPERLNAALVVCPPARWFTPDARAAWMPFMSRILAHHVALTGDIRFGWVRVDAPLAGDPDCCARLLMHGPSLSRDLFNRRA